MNHTLSLKWIFWKVYPRILLTVKNISNLRRFIMTFNSNAGGVICSALSIVSSTGPCGIEKIVVLPRLRNESHSDPAGFLWNFSQFWSKIRLGKMRFRWKVSWMKNNLFMYDYEFTSSQLQNFDNRVLLIYL